MTPMVVQCSSCLTEFELDPRKVPTNGVRARCSVCSAVIAIPAPPRERSEPPGEAPSAPRMEPHVVSVQPPVQPPSEEKEAPHAARAEEARPQAAPPSVSTMSSTPPPPPASGESPAAPPGAAATRTGEAAPAGSTPPGGVSRRPINPFLSRDPALRAKRLARALVSDIVAYHPARHAEGLREGTLKTLFRDEIKKSYEEYVDQVGRDFATSTTHFQDALNDVLAGGKKLF